ncbi:MAG: hypothetical protein R1F54_02020 [Candidatus Zeuxoniibacter abyssi]|nr:MAG: hypothetical protein R1F54_02020 [Candidatus Persebacteraceae bacterium AB1(2)]
MIEKDNDAGIVADKGENFALYFQDFVKREKCVREVTYWRRSLPLMKIMFFLMPD